MTTCDASGPASCGEPEWTCGICGRVNMGVDLRCAVCQRIHGKTLDWTKLQSNTRMEFSVDTPSDDMEGLASLFR